MRFGKSAAEAAEEPGRGGSGGDFIRYLKDGDTTFRLLQEPEDWTYYWEHFDPRGFSYPCSNEPDCPGCTSDVEKTKKAQRRIAFNVIQGYNGTDYVNVYKVGTTVADKLKNRYNKLGTIIDRDYTVTRTKTGDRYDFDLEGSTPTPVDPSKFELKDVESLLQQAWDDAWGEDGQGNAGVGATPRTPQPAQPPQKRIAIAPQPVASEEPPFEEPEVEYQESTLRAMEYEDLVTLVKKDLGTAPPEGCTTSSQVVDWLMSIQP